MIRKQEQDSHILRALSRSGSLEVLYPSRSSQTVGTWFWMRVVDCKGEGRMVLKAWGIYLNASRH